MGEKVGNVSCSQDGACERARPPPLATVPAAPHCSRGKRSAAWRYVGGEQPGSHTSSTHSAEQAAYVLAHSSGSSGHANAHEGYAPAGRHGVRSLLAQPRLGLQSVLNAGEEVGVLLQGAGAHRREARWELGAQRSCASAAPAFKACSTWGQ